MCRRQNEKITLGPDTIKFESCPDHHLDTKKNIKDPDFPISLLMSHFKGIIHVLTEVCTLQMLLSLYKLMKFDFAVLCGVQSYKLLKQIYAREVGDEKLSAVSSLCTFACCVLLSPNRLIKTVIFHACR